MFFDGMVDDLTTATAKAHATASAVFASAAEATFAPASVLASRSAAAHCWSRFSAMGSHAFSSVAFASRFGDPASADAASTASTDAASTATSASDFTPSFSCSSWHCTVTLEKKSSRQKDAKRLA